MFLSGESYETWICSPGDILNRTDNLKTAGKINLVSQLAISFFCTERSELLTNVGIQLCESTFLPTPPIPFPSHTKEIVCGSFQSTGWILDGISKQRGNPDMFLLSLCAATCSASVTFRRRLLYWDSLNECKGSVHRLISPWRKE